MALDQDYLFNHVVSRIPTVGARLRAYAALGVSFDDRSSAMIALGVRMWGGKNLSMGARATLNQECYIDARGGVRIDSDASVSREVCVFTAEHNLEHPEFDTDVAPVRLGSHCWLGARAMVLPGVTVGEGAVVAAGAVVTRDVEPYTVVAGVPARKIRDRPGPMTYELAWRPSWH
jgi:acetyltransferase-like isoleucine patch superfamily enzyme